MLKTVLTQKKLRRIHPIILLSRKQQEYSNFINSINSDETKKTYAYLLEQFLVYCKLDLHKFLLLSAQDQTNIIIRYLIQKKASRNLKKLIVSSIKRACDMNDVILNWKKIKAFTSSAKTGNELGSQNRGYEHKEISKIIAMSDQRVKTSFLILASTGMKIGGLFDLKVGDLEKIQDLYKVSVYGGEYVTFTTPETAKEIDAYLDYRRRRGENITNDSYVIVKRANTPFKGSSLHGLLQRNINNSGIRQVDSNNQFKRKQIPLLHGFRRFFTKQLIESKVNPEIREMMLGHKIGLTGVYYKPTEREMLNEYYKAVGRLTISDEERIKFKYEEHVKIQKSQYDKLQAQLNELRKVIKKK